MERARELYEARNGSAYDDGVVKDLAYGIRGGVGMILDEVVVENFWCLRE